MTKLAGVRAMLARVQRLEQARSPASPFERAYGSLEAFAASVRAGVTVGLLDSRDVVGEDGSGGVLAAVERWHRNGLWLNQA